MLVNRHPKLELFSHEDVERIHQATLKILAETGFAFRCEEALDILEATLGTKVDRDEERVWFDPQLVERMIAQCPASFTIHAPNPKYNRTIGGDNIAVRPTGAGCVFTHDLERGRRAGTLSDVIEQIKILHQLPEVDDSGGGSTTMGDVPVPLRPYVSALVTSTHTDKVSGLPRMSPQAGDVDRDPIAEWQEAVQAVYGSDWDYIARPVSQGGANSVSPLMYDDRMALSLINAARLGQPCIISPAAMGGLSAPMTLAGMIAVHNAEVLAGLVLVQAIRPGIAVGYGNVSTLSDMRVGMPAYGSPEMALSTNLTCMLARRYGIPTRGCGSMSESKLPDVQAGYEHMLTAVVAVLSGLNMFTHALGVVESMLCSSYELLMLDHDAIGMLKRLVQGPEITDEELAVDVIHEVGPQGMFLTTEHTYKHFKTAYFQPKLMDRQVYAEWVKRGATRADQRATQAWKETLASYEGTEVEVKPEVVKLYQEWIRRTESAMEEVEDWPRHLVGMAPAAGVR